MFVPVIDVRVSAGSVAYEAAALAKSLPFDVTAPAVKLTPEGSVINISPVPVGVDIVRSVAVTVG